MPSDQQLHLAALQGSLEDLKAVLDTGKVHVDCKDKVNIAFRIYSFNDRCTINGDVKLHINHCSTNIKKYSFSFRSAKQWNRLSSWTRRADRGSQSV
jgi:hypothetical protein